MLSCCDGGGEILLFRFKPKCCTLECVQSAAVAYFRTPSSSFFSLRPASVVGVAEFTLRDWLGCQPCGARRCPVSTACTSRGSLDL
jgi:hypothetical protein